MAARDAAAWVEAVLGLVFPALCPACGDRPARPAPRPFCPGCWAALPRLAGPLCVRCGAPAPGLSPGAACEPCRRRPSPLDAVRAVGPYRDGLRRAIHALKFEKRAALARPLGALLAEDGARLLPAPPAALADALVPVPLHPARLAERGFNQAALLAAVCAARWGLPSRPQLLRRVRATRPQSELAAAARRGNVAGAFAVPRPARVAGLRLLLVDDVVTTGATAEAAAAALRGAGARAVALLALARTGEAVYSNDHA